MAETRRSDLQETGAGPERDGRIESLLIEGLDRYFAGRYEEAVHIWTRVLFLDRAHPRAKAYIDRARTALAERQRRSDELLHASQSLLDQGKTLDARQLLTEAVAATGDDERAAALRMRLDRVERTRWDSPLDPVGPAVAAAVESNVSAGVWWALIIATSLVTLWLVVKLAVPGLEPIESSSPAVARARNLFQRGRLAEALVALDRVSAGDKRRAEADKLRVEIQQLLLAADAPRLSSSTDRPLPASFRRFN